MCCGINVENDRLYAGGITVQHLHETACNSQNIDTNTILCICARLVKNTIPRN